MRIALVFFVALTVGAAPQERRLKVGVTLRPYYSWVANIVGDAPVDVVPALGPDVDVHNYQPSPRDLERLAGLDAIVVNGLGHDAFIKGMIEASGNRSIKVINPNRGVPLIPYRRGQAHHHAKEKEKGKPPPVKTAVNPHTFLSLTSAVQQVYVLERELSALRPAHAAAFRKNARAYARRLRKLKAEATSRLAPARDARVATVHDGYSYFLQEFSIGVAAVIEPAHGVGPSAKELAATIEAIRKADVRVVLSELAFPKSLVETIRKESGTRVYVIDHVNSGEFSADRFEKAMRANVDVLVKALAPPPKAP